MLIKFGIKQKHSAIHTLIYFTEKKLSVGFYSCGIFVDFQRLIDNVDHNIVLKKYRIRGICNNWFSS